MHSRQLSRGEVCEQRPFAQFCAGTQRSDGRFSRSRQMVNSLREEFLYSEKRARDILFREMEAILFPGCSPMGCSELMRLH